ncbi:unnamed protein product, partial [Rodentolepis nana]|uniref:SH3_10 domain-containing protein n=1 Tax=Rodentolepis nana TaxID=102285 RepID=A0A0R3T2F4_RODNA
MNVGVNYNALEEERKRQELLLQELRDIESKLSTPSIRKTNLPNLASLVGVELEQNTQCLHYLTGISELERYISDVAAHFAERSIELSDPQALHSNVFSYKTLSDNVKSCWDYVEQLTMLAQIHIKTSAEYHQFFHEANEVEAKLEKQLQTAQRRQNAATEQNRRIKDVSKISNELREQLETMRNLWSRCIALVKRSESVVPIRLRLGGVSEGEVTLGSPHNRNGPVMVRALVSLTGPEYRIKQGDLLQLIDNQKDSHLWKVQTSSGIENVPSVCFWVMGNDVEAIERASLLKQYCKKTWLEIARLSRQRLYFEYIDILNKLTAKNPVCIKQKAFTDLIADIHNQLITPEEDDDRLRIALEKFQRSVIFKSHSMQEGEYALKEIDLVRLRTPLMRLQDHLIAVGLMQEEMKRLNEYIDNYLIEVKSEQKRISKMVDHLKQITKESQIQLADLSSQLSLYTENATKRPHYAIPEIDEVYRSKSQPFDVEVSSRPKRKLDGKRARSQTVHQLDAMVQIGSKCRSIETQSIDTTSGTDDSQRTSKKSRIETRIRRPPVQRCVMTQIGPSSKESCTQVDSSESPTTEECYVTEMMKANVRKGNQNRRRDARSVPVHNKRPVIQINSCTQLGTLKHERSVSPILSLIDCCHQCRRRGMRCRLVCEHISMETPRTYDTIDSYCQTLSSYGSTVRYINHDYANSCTQIGTITRDCVLSPVDFDSVPFARCREIERPSRAASRRENVYVEPGRKRRHSQEMQCVNVELDYTSPRYANIARSYPNIDRVYENAVNARTQREGRYEVHERRRTRYMSETEAGSSNHAHAVPTRYTTEASYHHTASLPDLLSSESDVVYSQIPPVPPRRRRNGQTAGSPTLKYTTVVAPEISRRRGMVDHCHSVPNIHDHLVQMDYGVDANEYQTRDVVMLENVSYAPSARNIGTVQHAISLPIIASPCYATACVPVCRPVVSTCIVRPCVRTFSTQVCEAPEVVEFVRDTGIAEMEITRVVKPERRFIQPSMKFVSVGTPAQKHYDVSCDAMIIPEYASKRTQIELFEEPKIIETRREEHVYSAPPEPMQTMTTQSVVGTHGKKLQFEPEMNDASCETQRPGSYQIIACQKDIKTSGKKLQVTIQVPEPMKLGSGEVSPIKKAGHGKKLQVNLATPLHVDVTQTIAEPKKSVADFQCDAIQPAPFEVGTSQSIWEEVPQIISQQEVAPVFVAPVALPVETRDMASETITLIETNDFSCDAIPARTMVGKKLQITAQPVHEEIAQAPLKIGVAQSIQRVIPTNDFSCDAEIPVEVSGKKLQVTPPPMESTTTQAHYMEILPESLIIATTQSKARAEVTTKEFGCEPIPVITQGKKLQVSPGPMLIEAGQALHTEIKMATIVAQTEAEPIMKTIGKKLQVEPPPLASIASQAIYEEPLREHLHVGQSQSIWEEPEPIIIKPLTPVAVVMSAPPLTSEFSCNPIPIMTEYKTVQIVPEPVVTKDFSCDAPLAISKQDFSCDAPEPIQTIGKKLQVSPTPLAAAVSQSNYIEEKPPLLSIIQSQAFYEKVKIEPLMRGSSQAIYTEPKQEPFRIEATQAIWVESPPIVLKQDIMPVFSAPVIESKDFSCETRPIEILTQDFACEAHVPVETQGKKLQVSPEPLVSSMSQSIYLEMEKIGKAFQVGPEPMAVTVAQVTYIEPKVSVYELYSGQVKEIEKIGKKLQVHPESLSAMTSQVSLKEVTLSSSVTQTIEPAVVEKVGKKLQVSPKPLEVSVSQAVYEESRPSPLETIRTQSIWVEPEPIIIKPATPEQIVMAAPAPLTSDFSCNPTLPTTQFKGVQVETVHLVTAGAQAVYVEPKAPALTIEAAQCAAVSMKDFTSDAPLPPQTIGKKLQVTPAPLTATSMQATYIAEKPAPLAVGACQAIYVAPKPAPLTTAISQVKFVEPAPKHVKDFSCDAPRPIETFGKKLQVMPEPLALAILQSTYSEPIQPKHDLTAVQVPIQPLSVSVCQATYTEPLLAGRSQTLWIEPEPIIIKAPSPKPMVFAAPPLPQTNDFSCGPLPTSSVGKKLQVSPEPLNSTIAQASYVESPIVAYETNVVQCRVPEMLGKKLQVAPAPLTAKSMQATYIAEKPA